jgi:hypothetical protein
MVMGRSVSRKATSSSRKVSHSGSKTNAAGRRVTFRELLGAKAIGARKEASSAEMAVRLQGV